MKKKLLAILMCATLALSMVACGGKEEAPAETPAAETEAPAEETEAPAETASNDYHFEIVVKSFKPCHFSGSGRRDLDSISIFTTLMEISPI